MASRDMKKTSKPKATAKPAPKASKNGVKKPAAKAPEKAAPAKAKATTAKVAAKAPAPAAKPAPKAAKGKVDEKHAPVKPAAKAPAAPLAKVPAAKTSAAKPEPTKAKVEAPKGKVEAPKGKPEAAKATGKPDAAPPVAVGPAGGPGGDKKMGPKGITIVQPKPVRRPRPKPKFEMPKSEPLIKPGGKWKPLIPSGPKAPPIGVIGGQDQTHLPAAQRVKSKFTKKELDGYRQILLRKRSELVGDIANMEDEALRQSSGSLSHVPQHMAEQGTDTYDQGLSLDLAAVDRNLLREIDDALKRIAEGTYGICERTGNPIKAERLQEIPWARYSIEAAREMERRPYQE